MNENINTNSISVENSTNDIIQNNNSDIKYSVYENNRMSKKIKTSNNNRKNKSTQLFEALLGSKLILTENSNMLIEKPFTIFEILDIFRSNVELDVKMELVEKLKMIVLKHHINSAIIMEKSSLKDSKAQIKIYFLDELIKILLDNCRIYMMF